MTDLNTDMVPMENFDHDELDQYLPPNSSHLIGGPHGNPMARGSCSNLPPPPPYAHGTAPASTCNVNAAWPSNYRSGMPTASGALQRMAGSGGTQAHSPGANSSGRPVSLSPGSDVEDQVNNASNIPSNVVAGSATQQQGGLATDNFVGNPGDNTTTDSSPSSCMKVNGYQLLSNYQSTRDPKFTNYFGYHGNGQEGTEAGTDYNGGDGQSGQYYLQGSGLSTPTYQCMGLRPVYSGMVSNPVTPVNVPAQWDKYGRP